MMTKLTPGQVETIFELSSAAGEKMAMLLEYLKSTKENSGIGEETKAAVRKCFDAVGSLITLLDLNPDGDGDCLALADKDDIMRRVASCDKDKLFDILNNLVDAQDDYVQYGGVE